MLQPLAYRMRPRQLEDILGQEHLVGQEYLPVDEGACDRRVVEAWEASFQSIICLFIIPQKA